MTDSELLSRALSFDGGPFVMVNGKILPDDYPNVMYHFTICARQHANNKVKWILIAFGEIYDKSVDEFVEIPLPSNSKEEFFQNTRFETPNELFDILTKWKEKELARCLADGFKRL